MHCLSTFNNWPMRITSYSNAIPGIHRFTSRKQGDSGPFALASTIAQQQCKKAQTLFGFGLATTANTTS